MLVSSYITRLNYALRGTDDDAPEEGSDEWTYWVDTLNLKKDELYQELWDSMFTVRSLGLVSASAAPTFNIPADFVAPSDHVYIVKTDGTRAEYTIVKPKERKLHTREVYIAGMNPQVLYVTTEIESTESIIGGTLYLPGYYKPADVDANSDIVPLIDPNWGVYAAAAEIAGNDITYEDKEANLNAKATNLYNLLKKNHTRGTYANPRTSAYNVPVIGMRSK